MQRKTQSTKSMIEIISKITKYINHLRIVEDAFDDEIDSNISKLISNVKIAVADLGSQLVLREYREEYSDEDDVDDSSESDD